MIKISSLPAAGALTGTELVPVVQGGVTDQTTTQAIANLAPGVAVQTHAATNKATPVNADEFPLADSAASYGLKKLTWANLKTSLNLLYMSLVAPGTAGNLLTSNGTDWVSTSPATAATVLTGTMIDYVGSTAPSGYVLADGNTIGDASSGGTERANADTSALFTLLWNSWADAQAPVSGGRGASAAADFAAHKTITLPDLRGRVAVGLDNMGGSTAGRITNAGSGITGTTLGASGGAETHTLTTAQLAVHSHGEQSDWAGSVGQAYATGTGSGSNKGIASAGGAISDGAAVSTLNAGSGNAHNNTQPSMMVTVIIKL